MIPATLPSVLLRSPKLKLYQRKIRDVLREEQKKRQEFYRTMREEDKVEFINGEVYFHSPVRLVHNRVCGLLLMLLKIHVQIHRLGFVGYEKLLISLTRNDYEPDICFFRAEKAAHFTPGQRQFPAPDLIIEVTSESTEANDRGVKFEDYAAHGVDEYWIVDPEKETIEQYQRVGDSYELLLKVNSGILRSLTVSGFELPVQAAFDEAENLKALRQMVG